MVDTAFELLETSHRLVQFAAVELTTHVTGRRRRLVTQGQRLLASAGFGQLVFQLADFAFHTRQRFFYGGHFMRQRGDQVGHFLFFDQCRTGQIFFLFTQCQFGFVLPIAKLVFTLLDTTQ
ncbi:hypothetical protein D3C81_1776350 [compost metagenome]